MGAASDKTGLKRGTGGRRRPGFTLIEVLVAIVVAGLGFMGAASMIIDATRNTGFSRGRTIALYLAESKLEELAREDYSVLGSLADDTGVPNEFKHLFKRHWLVENDKPARRMKTVTVTVVPQDRRIKPTSLSTIVVSPNI